MKISFQTTKLEKLCLSTQKLTQKFGKQVAENITELLEALDSSSSLQKVPSRLRPHPTEPKHQEVFQIDVQKHKHPIRLFFKPVGEYDILDRTTIVEVKIIEIKKTHS